MTLALYLHCLPADVDRISPREIATLAEILAK